MLLTKHENQTFTNQTVYISGQAFINCSFERCNWHVDWVLMWGSPESLREIKALVGLIEQAQEQAKNQQEGGQETTEGGAQTTAGAANSPFAT
jgi:hypothetical protein